MGRALPALKPAARPSWGCSGAQIVSEVGDDAVLGGDSRSPSQHLPEGGFGRAVVGSSVSFFSISLLIVIGRCFQGVKRLMSTQE